MADIVEHDSEATRKLVERLEDEARFGWNIAANRQADTRALHTKAAAEIKHLRATNARLSEALRRLTDIAYTVAYERNVGTMDDAIEQARTALTTPSTGKG